MTFRNQDRFPLRRPLFSRFGLACGWALLAAAFGANPAEGQNVVRGYAAPLPSYYGGYYIPAAAPIQVARPVMPAGYPGVTAYYGNSTYAVQPVRYVQSAAIPGGGSYSLSYGSLPAYGVAGGNPGQPVVAARPVYAYRPTYAAPVVYYRPTTAYQPVMVYQPAAGVAQTCGYAPQPQSCCQTSCAPRNCGILARLFPRLFGGGSSCNTTCYSSGCAPAACVPAGCGATPYYPGVAGPPVIPTVPAPGTPIQGLPGSRTIIPGNTIPSIPSAPPPVRGPAPGVTIPSPPLRDPANTIPSLNTPPGGFNPVPPATGGFNPAPNPGGFNPAPLNPGGFNPGTAPFNPTPGPVAPPTNPGGFNQNLFAPQSDPYQNPPPAGGSIFGSGYTPRPAPSTAPNSRIAEPGLKAPAGVRPFTDPEAPRRNENRAPQLLDPRDRTALHTGQFTVVPAVWPSRDNRGSSTHAASQQEAAYQVPSVQFDRPAPQRVLDDSGWEAAGR